MNTNCFTPEQVLDLWFPDNGHQNSMETHSDFWDERMQGGMDSRIIQHFGGTTEAAATGALDHWSSTPRGRLALLIALDQFPRSYWRDTSGSYAQDIKATRLALEGIDNGDFATLEPWEQSFFVIAISHCEGPDHQQRMEALTDIVEGIVKSIPETLAPMREGFKAQHARVQKVIERFGRHPHRNSILGRVSTPDEEAYIATGDFPHLRKPPAESPP